MSGSGVLDRSALVFALAGDDRKRSGTNGAQSATLAP